jgi:hypothetical protein
LHLPDIYHLTTCSSLGGQPIEEAGYISQVGVLIQLILKQLWGSISREDNASVVISTPMQSRG